MNIPLEKKIDNSRGIFLYTIHENDKTHGLIFGQY